jgi:hypothetical protein
LAAAKLLTRETSYMVFGHRPITGRATYFGPACENRQRTKPREGTRGRAVPLSLSGFEVGARGNNDAGGRPALALRHVDPCSRKISVTSSVGRGTTAWVRLAACAAFLGLLPNLGLVRWFGSAPRLRLLPQFELLRQVSVTPLYNGSVARMPLFVIALAVILSLHPLWSFDNILRTPCERQDVVIDL